MTKIMSEKKILLFQKMAIFLLFVIGVGLHYFCGNFSKAICVLPDELRYYSLARSISDGSGLMLRDWNVDFQKVAYSLLLAPLFRISDSELRVHLITLLNAIIMMSSVFPIVLVCREIKLGFREQFWIILLFMAWPELVFSVTVMSEVLLYPISFWWILVWVKYENKPSKGLAVLLGTLCYLGYLDKEVFATYLILFVIFEIYYIFKLNRTKNEKIVERAVNIVLFLLAFFLFFTCTKLTVFKGMGNSYDQQSIDVILNLHNFIYMLYAFYYHIISILIISMGVIILYPLFHLKSASLGVKKVYNFTILNVIGTCAVIAYTISVREDLDKTIPRVHFRYLGPLLFLLLIVFIGAIRENYGKRACGKKANVIYVVVVAFLALCIFSFKGFLSLGSMVDGFLPDAYKVLEYNLTTRLYSKQLSETIMIICTAIVGLVILLCVHRLKYKVQLPCVCMILLVILLFDKYRSYLKIYAAYKVPQDMVDRVVELDEFLEKQAYGDNVLFLTSKLDYDQLERCMDTYIDKTHGFYFVDELMMSDKYGNYGIDNVSEMAIIGSIWDFDYQQKYGVSEIAFVVTDCEGMPPRLEGVTKVSGLSNEYFEVFINDEPGTLEAVCE